ncbi:MAG: ATP-binding cassette domain-containing protein, partial [Oscillospiraceae bacterium]|nr:ATP-binding cassette domain-containing protein [Oscillospiraceae bacterium]
GIDLQLPEASCTAVVGRVPFCGYALLRAIAGEDAEQSSGSVLLNGKELNREDLLYIGSDRLLDKRATAFGWLMDVLGGAKKEKRTALEALFAELGIADIADTPIASLRYGQRMLLLLVAASYSDRKLLLINDPAFEVEAADEMAARRVFLKLAQAGKTVLIAGAPNALMGAVANRVAALDYGKLVFFGSMKEFVQNGCSALLFFDEAEADADLSALEKGGLFRLERENGNVTLRKGRSDADTRTAAKAALSAGVPVRLLRSCEKSFSLACKEVFGA